MKEQKSRMWMLDHDEMRGNPFDDYKVFLIENRKHLASEKTIN